MPFLKPISLIDSQHLIGTSKIKVYLVYYSKECHWWSKYLKEGYKHVFAVIFDGLFWIKMDFLLGYTEVNVLCYDNHDTIENVTAGLDVITQCVEVRRKPRYRALFAPCTCVEAMKALLGIKARLVLTPYQLYKYCEANHG